MMKSRQDGVCYGCHTDAQARFVKTFTHKPVLEGNCSGCHDGHASENAKLLKAEGPRLCLKCHEPPVRKVAIHAASSATTGPAWPWRWRCRCCNPRRCGP